MNERIKELAQEVFSFKYKTAPNELNPGHHMDHLHKFAELIVRECIDIAQDRANFPGFPPNDVNDIIDEIKQHFGVE